MPKRQRRCAIRGCRRPHEARGWCKRHYARWVRYGSPLAGYRPKGAAQAWILAHVGHTGGKCLIWPLCRGAHGDPPSPKHQAAHTCRNGRRGCVHPQHLHRATDAERRAADAAR